MVETIFDTYWHVSYDQALDFWSICLWAGDIEYQIAACMEEQVAKHLVRLHNKEWDGEIWDSYANNIMAVYDRELTEFYIAEAERKSYPLTEDEWFYYPTPYEEA
jgi:hypothetical protein